MLVMEYIPMCLERYVYKNIPPSDIRTRILSDIAQGLQYLHNLDPPMIHCDLTTSNVLLTSNLHAKVSDFGESKLLDHETLRMMTRLPGNRAHMPPEAQVEDEYYSMPTTDMAKKLDIFSFGCVVINVLIGDFPHTNGERGRQGTEVQRRNHLLVRIPESKEKEFVICCLSNNPEHRPAIDQVVDFFSQT
jgi:serine/threonine protein kinase